MYLVSSEKFIIDTNITTEINTDTYFAPSSESCLIQSGLSLHNSGNARYSYYWTNPIDASKYNTITIKYSASYTSTFALIYNYFGYSYSPVIAHTNDASAAAKLYKNVASLARSVADAVVELDISNENGMIYLGGCHNGNWGSAGKNARNDLVIHEIYLH